MPLGDVTYQDAALDAIAATFPAGSVWRLYDGDPTTGGTELPADGGYVPAAYDPADWDPAADGEKATTDPVTLPDSTDAYGAVATNYGLTDPGGVLVYTAELDAEIEVSEPGTTVQFTPAIFFDDIL